MAQEILTIGATTKPVLGVAGNLTAGAAAPGAATGSLDGAQVAAVIPGSPAATAGLTPGDVITKVDNIPVHDFVDLAAQIGSYAPGSTVTLTLATGRTITVTLGSAPDTAPATLPGPGSGPLG